MRQSTIENCTNNLAASNSTHIEAWVLGYYIRKWSIWNVLLWFQPPVLKAVSIIPKDLSAADPTDTFEPDMFKPNGLFFTTPLNHYLRLQLRGQEGEFFVNAGTLIEDFIASKAGGFRTLKRLMKRAQEEFAKTDPPEGCACDVQEKGISQFG